MKGEKQIPIGQTYGKWQMENTVKPARANTGHLPKIK
jgi:hypothetical protein